MESLDILHWTLLNVSALAVMSMACDRADFLGLTYTVKYMYSLAKCFQGLVDHGCREVEETVVMRGII